MNKFIPKMYKKNIFDIDFEELRREKDIKVLLFDFDNTIIEKGNYEISKKTKNLFSKLSDNFIVYIVSNSFDNKKLSKFSSELGIPYVGASMKPFAKGFKKIKFKSIKNSQVAMIGDQLFTDVYGGNRMGYLSILVDPLVSGKDVIFTKFNRFFENRVFSSKKNNLVRGNYYD